MSYAIPDDTRLKGVFTPMRFEATVDECIVTAGEIPADIAGGFYRSGPSWKRPSRSPRPKPWLRCCASWPTRRACSS